jgi:predicted secreted protein
MFVRSSIGARLVVVMGLSAMMIVAGCSSPAPSFEHPASSQAARTATATSAAKTTAAGVPMAANIAPPTSQLTIDCDAFARQPKASAKVHLASGDVLYVTLCSNASTGFSWDQPVISGDALSSSGVSTGMPASGPADAGTPVPPVGVAPSDSQAVGVSGNQATLVSEGPSDSVVVGAASSTTFMLKAEHAGSSTVTLSYSRPWAGGEKGVWEYTIDVTID